MSGEVVVKIYIASQAHLFLNSGFLPGAVNPLADVGHGSSRPQKGRNGLQFARVNPLADVGNGSSPPE